MTRGPLFTTFFSRYGFLLAISMGSAISAAHAQPVTGFYTSGAAGANFQKNSNPGITGLGSFGWGLGNGFRVEAEGNYRNNSYGLGHQHNYGGMANALFDMDIGENWIYPYFGAGIGYGAQKIDIQKKYLGSHLSATNGNFAYQAIVGVSLPVPPIVGLSTTLEYRYYSIIGHHPSDYTGNSTQRVFNHSLMLGLRYEFTPAPPPPKVQPTSMIAPAPTATRTYLVFFDWDSSTLSNKARMIINEAARNASSTQVTHIEVNGHTDMSGQKTQAGRIHNQALSLKRARAVESELIRDGIAAGLIEIHAFGSSQPLVTTGIGVKEAQNRRVEIDLK